MHFKLYNFHAIAVKSSYQYWQQSILTHYFSAIRPKIGGFIVPQMNPTKYYAR